MDQQRKGFTLIELMIVVGIIGVLAAIAMPKFVEMLRKSKEGHTKGALASLRTAVASYYSAEEGSYPTDLNVIKPQYIDEIPAVSLGEYHQNSSSFVTALSTGISSTEITDANGWIYTSVGGIVTVNCSHTDVKGAQFFTW